jgi:LuxR family transcriptional regulator, maltose regulon positive regulatory protein
MPLFSSNKTYLPSFSYSVLRPHLIKQLQQAIAYKVILVIAPPGYGKTTAIAQFAHQTTRPVLWQTVEEHDRDLPELFHNVVGTLSTLFPNIQDLSFNPNVPPLELGHRITTYLRENTTEDFIYVLDDVHHLIAAPAVEAWLHAFVTQLPKQCHMIIGSRLLPNLPIQEMVAKKEIDILKIDQLQFNADDLITLAEIHGVPLSINDAQEMVERLDGWAAGLALALQTSSPHQIKQAFREYLEPETLFAELAESMFNTQPPSLQHFMLKTSVPKTITPEVCSLVLQIPDSLSYLEQLFQQGFFLTKTDGKLRYHSLFQEFLQKEFQRRNPTQFQQLHKQFATWAEKNEREDIAFEHFIKADCIGEARNIADRMANPYVRKGRVELLLLWLKSLQSKGVCSPRLWHACAGISINRYHYPEAETLVNEATVFLQSANDLEGLNVLRLQKATLLLRQGEYREAIDLIEDLRSISNFHLGHQGRALHITGLSWLHLGEVQKAGSHLEQALEEARRLGDLYFISRVLQDLDVIYMRLGQIDAASACLQEAVTVKRAIGDSTSLAMALNNLGYHYHQRGEYGRAAEAFDEGFKIATRLGDNRVESYLLWSLGDLHRDRGAFTEAYRLYTKALQFSKKYEPSLRCSILLSLSTLHRWKGEYYEAKAVAEDTIALAEKHSLQLELYKAEAFYAVAHFSQTGKVELEVLEEKINQLRSLQAEGDVVVLYALSSLVALQIDNNVIALDYLRILEKTQYASVQPAIAEIYHTSKLKDFLVQHSGRFKNIKREFDMLHNAQVTDKLPLIAMSKSSQIFSLDVRTLGLEEIRRDGQLISIQQWRATRAKELFFYLLSAGPISKEDLYITLWSDSSPDQLRNNFHSTLHRIRHVLGENVIQYEGDLYQINPHIDLTWDVKTVLRMQKEIKNLSPYDARITEGLRKAISLYQGDFLPTISSEWVLNQRELMRQVYIDLLVVSGDTASARYEYQIAIQTYRKALIIDPYSESIYRKIMQCQGKMGERSQVALEFKKLKKLLKEDLGIEPSEETRLLAMTLLG